jgi:type II secretory pathway pseudopilin PulG
MLFALNPFKLIRGLAYALFGTLVLSTLWVTSLTILSDRANATAIVAEAGTSVLNPFLTKEGLGITASNYAKLQSNGKVHPTQPLSLSVLKVKVPGGEITKLSYADGVRHIYSRVAEAYYDGGAGAVFEVPPQLKAVLPNFALFDVNKIQIIPGERTPNQLPPFLQPIFTFVGLTPDTFTAAGHQHLLNLLPWFWIVTGVLGLLAVVFNRSETKLEGLAHGLTHGAWPVVALIGVAWVLSSFVWKEQAAPYVGLLGLVAHVFLPVYGGAFVLGLLGIAAAKLLPGFLKGRREGASSREREPVAVAASRRPSFDEAADAYPSQPARPSPSAMYPQTGGYGSDERYPQTAAYPPSSAYPPDGTYPQGGAYPPQGQYPQQGGGYQSGGQYQQGGGTYTPDGQYQPPSGAYPPTEQYPPTSGQYPPSNRRPPIGGYPQGSGYPPSTGYPPNRVGPREPEQPFDPRSPSWGDDRR